MKARASGSSVCSVTFPSASGRPASAVASSVLPRPGVIGTPEPSTSAGRAVRGSTRKVHAPPRRATNSRTVAAADVGAAASTISPRDSAIAGCRMRASVCTSSRSTKARAGVSSAQNSTVGTSRPAEIMLDAPSFGWRAGLDRPTAPRLCFTPKTRIRPSSRRWGPTAGVIRPARPVRGARRRCGRRAGAGHRKSARSSGRVPPS